MVAPLVACWGMVRHESQEVASLEASSSDPSAVVQAVAETARGTVQVAVAAVAQASCPARDGASRA